MSLPSQELLDDARRQAPYQGDAGHDDERHDPVEFPLRLKLRNWPATIDSRWLMCPAVLHFGPISKEDGNSGWWFWREQSHHPSDSPRKGVGA